MLWKWTVHTITLAPLHELRIRIPVQAGFNIMPFLIMLILHWHEQQYLQCRL